MKKFYLFIVLLLFGISNLDAQIEDSKGKDFWVTFPPNFHNNKLSPTTEKKYGDSLYLFIVADVPTNGTIVYKDSSGREYTHNFSITNPAEVYTFKVSYYNFELVGYNDSGLNFSRNQSERVAKQSFHITSDNEIVVYGHSQAVTTSDAFMIFPTDILGNDYLIMAYSSDTEVGGTSMTPSQFAVVATEDNTLVQIDAITSTYAHGFGLQEVTLNKGEAYLVQANVMGAIYNSDLTGSSVQSSKPIAVFAGHQRATVPVRIGNSSASRDFLISQMPPIRTWGKNYFITPFVQPTDITNIGTDLFRILAAYNLTEVSINGQVVAILNKGEFYEGELTNSAYISANSPILVGQFKKTSQSSAFQERSSDPFFVVIPPKEQFMTSYKVMNTQAYQFNNFYYEKVYTEHYITLVVPASARNEMNLDGTNVQSNLFQRISNSDYYYANIPVSEGQHSVSSITEFGIIVYGYGIANSYGYVGGLSFKPHDFKSPEIISNINCFELNGAITDTALYDSGVISINIPDNRKINCDVEISSFTQFQKVILFSAKLIDNYQDGEFKIEVVDSMHLETNELIEIPGFTLKNELQDDESIPFSSYIGKLNSEYCIDIPIKNYGKFEQTIKDINLHYPEQFRITTALPLKIAAGKVEIVRLCFFSEFDSTYVDSIVIANECAQRNVLNLKFGTQTDKNSPQSAISYDPCFEYSEVVFYDSLIYDKGLEKIEVEKLTNCKADFKIISSEEIKLKITVLDFFKDAIYELVAIDSLGNTTKLCDTIQGFTISSPLFEPDNNYLNYNNCYIGNLYCDSILFFNYGLLPFVINDAIIARNVYFSIPQSQFPLVIEPQESKQLMVCFSPINTTIKDYNDTLYLNFHCLDMHINLYGDSKPVVYEGVSNCNVPITISSNGLPAKSYMGPVYPNPTNKSINIEFGLAQKENVEISVYDVFGNIIELENLSDYSQGYYSHSINVENFPQGQYFIQLRLGVNIYFANFMKFN